MDRYRDVATEEAERLFDYLNLQLDEVANCCAEVVVYASNRVADPKPTWQPVTVNMIMYTCMAHLFIEVIDSGRKTWADYPAWVRELYERASASEVFAENLLDGELAVL